jgi:hypothetical protein
LSSRVDESKIVGERYDYQSRIEDTNNPGERFDYESRLENSNFLEDNNLNDISSISPITPNSPLIQGKRSNMAKKEPFLQFNTNNKK